MFSNWNHNYCVCESPINSNNLPSTELWQISILHLLSSIISFNVDIDPQLSFTLIFHHRYRASNAVSSFISDPFPHFNAFPHLSITLCVTDAKNIDVLKTILEAKGPPTAPDHLSNLVRASSSYFWRCKQVHPASRTISKRKSVSSKHPISCARKKKYCESTLSHIFHLQVLIVCFSISFFCYVLIMHICVLRATARISDLIVPPSVRRCLSSKTEPIWQKVPISLFGGC